MTILIQGHSVLRSSPVLGQGIQYRYRLTLDAEDRYSVHREDRHPNGACGEWIMWQGNCIEKANQVFDIHAV